jgi:Pentapeptide repeats (8 copies)
MRRATCLLLLTLASLLTSESAHAESGSCYAAGQMDDGFLNRMLLQLVREGKAFRLTNGGFFAGLENLPNATICDLKDIDLAGADLTNVDLSNIELSDAELEAAQLGKAILCNTVLPDGTVSRRDCE